MEGEVTELPQSRRRRRRSANQGRAADMAITQPRRKTNPWYIAASVVIAILVIGGFAVGGLAGLAPSASDAAGSSNEYVEGVGEAHPIMPTRQHVLEGQEVTYSTTPPTSGDHWDFWARCGFYEKGLPDERIVHNLEHGNIVVSYNLTAPEEVAQLKDLMDNFDLAPAWAVTRFYNKIPEGSVALAAWGVLDTMTGVDEDRIEKFFRHYAGTLGPEFPNGAPCASSGVTDSP